MIFSHILLLLCSLLLFYSLFIVLLRFGLVVTIQGSVVVTYGSSSRHSSADVSERRDEPPLAVIPPPEKLSVLSKLDRSSRENLELSRRIYDVRDAFRNILQAALTTGTSSRRSTPQPHVETSEGRVRSLAAMCASTVGVLRLPPHPKLQPTPAVPFSS